MAGSERVAIVTGGANGIGAACARRLAEEGVRVVIADLDKRAGDALAQDLGAAKGRALFVSCDVSDKLAVANLMADTLSAFGQLDILINNAAITAKGDILELEASDFDKVMSVNLRGAFLVARAAARQMTRQIDEEDQRTEEARRRYAIVNMSSVNAVVSIADQLAYSTSKGAINQMTKAMALSLAPYGIRVNAIGPGSVNTDMLKTVNEDKAAMDSVLSRTPLARIADPDEIASIAWFLASKESSYITGTCIYADGGRLALNYVMKREDYED
ncbi:MAG: 3-oxoacyl-[acyl-carrier protein] reductase [Oceanicaulis sp. HLUCCA04]|nr:MAG: 3-oxoacyl-[acyl-carrier protein] reductase [Oceanicaulis sp. HLUCCA04]